MSLQNLGAEDGVMRGFLIREENFDEEQVSEFFRLRDEDPDTSRWRILQKMGVPQERSRELRTHWREVGPLAKLLHREIEMLPTRLREFTWELLCNGLAEAAAVRAALSKNKQYAAEGLNTTPVQILVAEEQLTPQAFIDYIQSRGEVILECSDCHQRSWMQDFEPEETYICDGCMGTLDRLKTVDRLVAQMGDNDDLIPITPREIIGGFEVCEAFFADPTGQLHRDANSDELLIKELNMAGQPKKEALREFRMFLGNVRQLDDPHLMPATRLACDNDCYHLIFEPPPGQPLIGHPQPPRGKDALAVIHSLARGLLALHREGMTHGSVRPANVWLTEDGSVPACLLAAGEALQPGLSALPDDMFVPPGLVNRHDVDLQSDLYGLGVLMVWLMTGKLVDPDNPSLALKVMPAEPGKITGRLLGVSEPYDSVRPLLLELRPLLGEHAPTQICSTRRVRRPSGIISERRANAAQNTSARLDKRGPAPLTWIVLGLALLGILAAAWGLHWSN